MWLSCAIDRPSSGRGHSPVYLQLPGVSAAPPSTGLMVVVMMMMMMMTTMMLTTSWVESRLSRHLSYHLPPSSPLTRPDAQAAASGGVTFGGANDFFRGTLGGRKQGANSTWTSKRKQHLDNLPQARVLAKTSQTGKEAVANEQLSDRIQV